MISYVIRLKLEMGSDFTNVICATREEGDHLVHLLLGHLPCRLKDIDFSDSVIGDLGLLPNTVIDCVVSYQKIEDLL